jgi:hypothetical protein
MNASEEGKVGVEKGKRKVREPEMKRSMRTNLHPRPRRKHGTLGLRTERSPDSDNLSGSSFSPDPRRNPISAANGHVGC